MAGTRTPRGDHVIEPERLRALPLFGDLDAYDLSHIARWVEEATAEPGELLIEQGTMPYELFVIEEGTVDVVRDGEPIASLGAGDVVGEIALLGQHRRIASVVARTPVRVLTLHVDALQEITAEMPELGDELRELMDRRRQANDAG
jgi:CRP/FNR family transcriptional regulator, cyclic AMP receptor protein